MTDDLSRGFGTDSDTAAHTNGAAESGPGIGGDAFTGAAGDDSLSGQAQIEVGKPAAGEIVQIDAQPGQTYVLDFDPAEAQALVQGDNLVLIFPDGGQIVFENLVALVQQEDGPSLLVAGTDLIPLLVAQGIIPGVHEGFELNQPDPGETIVVTAEAGQRYIINFDPALAQVQVDGDDLVLVFANGGRIVIQDLGTLAGGPGEPVFDIAGNEVPGGTLFGQAVALGGEEGGPQGLPTLETAAGETVPTSGGVGDYSDDFGQDIGLLNPQGVIPPVELAFGVPLLEPGPVEGVEAGAPSLTATFKTTVPGFGVGTFPGGFEDWQPLQHVGDHSEFAMKILPTFTPADPGQDLTGLTISGIPSGAKFFVGGTAPGDEIAVVGGKVTLTPAQIADGLYLLPPADSDHDIPLTFTANFENADGSTGSVVAHGTAVIDAVADQPVGDLFQGELGDAFFTVGAEGGQFDSFSVYGGDGDVLDPTDGGEFCLTEGGRVFVQIDALFGDFLDGSETHTYVIEGVPDDWTENFDSAGVTGVDFVKQADGTWLATVSGDGPTGWISFNTNGWTGETTLTVKAVADENPPSDGELTLANNVAEIVGQVTLCIDEDTPIVGEPTNLLVDEDDLVPFGTDQTAEPAGDRIDEGSVSVDFFSDQPGNLTAAFAFTGGSPATGPNGEAVTYTPSGDGQSMTASIGGVDIFTVEITGATDNGGGNVTYDYQITLLNEMDHLIGDNGENTFDFTADFTVTDSDGDSASSSFDATVVDDVPETTQNVQSGTVEEEQLPTGNEDATAVGGLDGDTVGPDDFNVTTTVATGSLAGVVNFGADQPGSFSLDSIANDAPVDSGLTSGGATVWYVSDGDTLTAFVDEGDGEFGAGDTTIFTLALSGANNETWTFTLQGPLDHHPIAAADDVEGNLEINLSGLLTATDADGDTVDLAARALVVAVIDDIPIANDDGDAAAVGVATPVTGNVLDGVDGTPNTGDAGEDSAGADGVGVIRSVSHNGVTYTLSDDGTAVSNDGGQTLGVEYDFDGTTLTINETDAGGSFSIDLQGADIGDYSYTAPAADPSAASDAFTYVLEDGDGDADPATLTISLDDVPTAENSAVIVDEDGLPAGNGDSAAGDDVVPNDDGDNDESTSEGSLVYDAGANGFKSLTLDVTEGQNVVFSGTATQIESGGVGLVWHIVSGTVIEAVTDDVNATPVLRVTLSNVAATGADYDVELLGPLDHPVQDDPGTGPVETAFEDNILIDIGYTVTDNDDDTESAVLTVTVDDDVPLELAGTSSDTVYENELATVWSTGTDQAGITGDNDNATAGNDDTIATGSVASLVDFGADGPAAGGGFALASDTSGLDAQGWTSQGETVKYSVSGGTLTAYVDVGGGTDDVYDDGTDRAIFTLVLAANGDWTFTLMDQLDHVIGDGNDTSLTIDLSSMVVATDGDGDSITLADGFTVAVVDDVPNAVTADPALVANTGDAVGSGELNFIAQVGADEPGDIVFNSALNGTQLFRSGGGDAITSDGEIIFLSVSGDGHTLTALADMDGNFATTGDQTTVFTVVLDPVADTYTIDFDQTLDDGAGVSFDDFSQAPAGQNEWIGIDDPRDPLIDGPLDINQDLLFTGGEPIATDTVNTSSFGVGTNSQSIVVGDMLRLDYVENINITSGDAKDLSTLTYDQHYTVNNSSFTIIQTGGPATNQVDVYVTAWDADNDQGNAWDTSDDSQDTIISVTIFDENGVLVGTFTSDSAWVDFNSDGTGGATILNILEGYEVFVSTADGFNRMEMTNVTSEGQANDTFDLGGFAVSSATAGDPINMDFALTVTDEDLDSTTGTLSVTSIPDGNADILGTGADETLIGGSGNETLTGAGGDDTLTGGSGIDTFVYDLGADEGSDKITDFDHTSDVLSFSDVVDGGGNDVADVDAMISSIANDGGGHVQVTFNSGTVIDLTSVAFAGQTSIADLVDNPDQIQVTHV